MAFTLSPATCPECGKLAVGTVDVIPGIALIEHPEECFLDNPTFYFRGETKVLWDGQDYTLDNDGNVLVTCRTHEWYAKLEEVG